MISAPTTHSSWIRPNLSSMCQCSIPTKLTQPYLLQTKKALSSHKPPIRKPRNPPISTKTPRPENKKSHPQPPPRHSSGDASKGDKQSAKKESEASGSPGKEPRGRDGSGGREDAQRGRNRPAITPRALITAACRCCCCCCRGSSPISP